MNFIVITKIIIIPILILASISTYNDYNYDSTIINNLTLQPDQKYESLIPARRAINITIRSIDNIPFVAKIYKSNGAPLKYKTNIIKCQGKIDYIEIENSGDKENNIVLQMNDIDKVRNFSASSLMAILTTTVVIIYEKKSVPTKVMLFLFLIVQLYELPYNVEISERVFKKLLF